MKIEKKYYNIVFSCLAAIIISVPIAFIMVVLNFGFQRGFLLAFFKSALISILISIPLATIGIPIAKKLTDILVEKNK